jgi:hypothetical protein
MAHMYIHQISITICPFFLHIFYSPKQAGYTRLTPSVTVPISVVHGFQCVNGVHMYWWLLCPRNLRYPWRPWYLWCLHDAFCVDDVHYLHDLNVVFNVHDVSYVYDDSLKFLSNPLLTLSRLHFCWKPANVDSNTSRSPISSVRTNLSFCLTGQ